MLMSKALRQMPAGQAGRVAVAHGEAARAPTSDQACGPQQDTKSTGSAPPGSLPQAALTRENLQRALKRVRANKGAAWVDGLDISQTIGHLRFKWPALREQPQQGTYRPRPVRRVLIPKPDGGEREPGIPMELLREMYARLHLTVNETKSAEASVFGRKFLGYSLWAAPKWVIKLRVADKPMTTYKQRIRQLTRRSGGRGMGEVEQRLRPYMLGWKAYFGLSQTPRVWRTLDEWLRHRLRAIQLKHWKRGATMFRELRALGASVDVAAQVAGNSRKLVAQQQPFDQNRADDCLFR